MSGTAPLTGASMDRSRYVYPAEARKTVEKRQEELQAAGTHEERQTAIERLNRAVEELRRAKGIGFHRDPRVLSPTDRCRAIWAWAYNPDGLQIRLTNVPVLATWPRWHPEEPSESWIRQRDENVKQYAILSETRRWAFDGLARLLVTLTDRGESIPAPLKEWACRVAYHHFKGTLKDVTPPKPRGTPHQDDRDLRIYQARQWLLDAGWSKRRAHREILDAVGHEVGLNTTQSVRSACRKIEGLGSDRPPGK